MDVIIKSSIFRLDVHVEKTIRGYWFGWKYSEPGCAYGFNDRDSFYKSTDAALSAAKFDVFYHTLCVNGKNKKAVEFLNSINQPPIIAGILL